MKTETVKLAELKHPEINPRKHPVKQLNEFMRSIEKYGQYRPFVIDENNVVYVGNGMLDAMVQLGITDGVAYRLSGISDEEKKKLMLSDNKIYQYGIESMADIDELMSEFTDFDIPGFDESILESLYLDNDDDIEDIMGYGEVPKDFVEQRIEISKQRDDKIEMKTASEYIPQEEHVQKETYITCPKCGERIAI